MDTLVENNRKIDYVLDVRKLPCPIPTLRVIKSFSKVPAGGILKILTTAKLTLYSIPDFAKYYGHKILEFYEEDNYYVYFIQIKEKESQI